jgi:NitT/TauT family transport system permease protein
VSGLQQAWGFAWKALMAGELITAGLRATGLGQLLQRSQNDVPTLIAAVAVIVVIGVAVEYFLFGRVDRRIRRKRGLIIDG